MIRAENISKTFKVHKKDPGLMGSLQSLFKREWIEKQALKNINLEINEGEIVGLIGSNGAGKTTLVKILSGIIHPTSGQAEILGHTPWDRHNEFRRNMALIMGQKAQLWWDLPALDCFLLLKEIYQISDKEYKDTIEELSKALDINDQLKVQVRRLSLGERMKVELMAALLHRPKVIYLDEPTIGLDLTAQKAIRQFILEYQREYKPAVILTSHYMEDIESLCKRIILIKDGEFIYDGSLQKIVGQHALTKTIIAHAKNNNKEMIIPEGLGKLKTFDDRIEVTTERENMEQAIRWIMENYKIDDISVIETEIGDVIESVMSKGM